MKKTKIMSMALATFVATIMLMASCVAGPIEEKSSIDAGEEKKQKLMIIIEDLLSKVENDSELKNIIENTIEQKNKDTTSDKLVNQKNEKSFLELSQNKPQTNSDLSSKSSIQEKEAYADLKSYFEKTYSKDIKNIKREISSLSIHSSQSLSSGSAINPTSDDDSEPIIDVEISGSMAIGCWWGANAEVESINNKKDVISDPIKHDGRRLFNNGDNLGSIPKDEIKEFTPYDSFGDDSGKLDRPLKNGGDSQRLCDENGKIWSGFARTIGGGIIGPDGEIYYPGDPGYQQLLDLEWRMKANQDISNGINGFSWLEILDGVLALGLAVGIVSGGILFSAISAIFGAIAGTIIGACLCSPDGDYGLEIIGMLDVLFQALQFGGFLGVEAGIWAWEFYYTFLSGEYS